MSASASEELREIVETKPIYHAGRFVAVSEEDKGKKSRQASRSR